MRPQITGDGETYRSAQASEADQVARIAAGERGEALEALVDAYSARLFGLGMRMLGDRGMAEELVQDTFVRIWRSAGRYDPERGSVRTFIYAIARNAAIDLQRRAASRPLPSVKELEDREGAGEEQFERVITGLELRDAMETLSEKHRDTILLYYGGDLTQPQIARRLEVPLGTVKTRAHHALRALRREMEVRGLGT